MKNNLRLKQQLGLNQAFRLINFNPSIESFFGQVKHNPERKAISGKLNLR